MITDMIKYYGTTYVWKMPNIQQDFVLHGFKFDDELPNEQTSLTPITFQK